MIRVEGLTKQYGPHTAVDNVSFEVGKGEIVGFLGPNGAGKSTTMNIVTGYLSATQGKVLIENQDILDEPLKTKEKVGYLPEAPPLYPEMTVDDYLKFCCKIKKVPKNEIQDRIDSGLETVKILDVRKRLLRNLSKGYKQRVGLAQALMGDPEILILDEPTAGLDPKQIIEIRDLINSLGESHTVVLSSHILPEVSAVCRRVIIINNGRIVADGNLDTLAQELYDRGELRLRVVGDVETVESVLSAMPDLESINVTHAPEPESVDVLLKTREAKDIRRDVFRALAAKDMPIIQMSNENLSLEEIFLQLTVEKEVG